MSTKKYTLIIVVGIVMLSLLGGSFAYFYSKKTQNSNSLSAIPTDVVALIRVNQPGVFLADNNGQSLFKSIENPHIVHFLSGLSTSKEFGAILNNPILISFHPTSHSRLTPLLVLNSNEEYSNHKLERILHATKLNLKQIDYNGNPLFGCTFNDGTTLYVYHSKGLTIVTSSLVLCQTAALKIESANPVEEDLQNAFNLTSSSSDASIAINIKAITPWLKENLFSEISNFTQAANDICKWFIADYQQGAEEVAISGMLTVNGQTKEGQSLLEAEPSELQTPLLITENTAFCIEKNINNFNETLKRLPKPADSTKTDLRNLMDAINPDKAILEHIKNRQTDSSGFVAILYPHSMDSTQADIENMRWLNDVKVGQITQLKFDTISVKLQEMLGSSFGLVSPSFIYMDDERIILAAKSENIEMFLADQSLAAMRKDDRVNETWRSKITSNGVAAIYFNPNFSASLINELFKGIAKNFLTNRPFQQWNGLGLMLTSNGSNLLLSGYISRKGSTSTTPNFHYALNKQTYHKTLINLTNGKSIIAIATNDSLIALNGKLQKLWRVKIDQKPDTIFSTTVAEHSLIGLCSKGNFTFYNEKGDRVSTQSIGNETSKIACTALKSPSNNLIIVDKDKNVFAVNPSRNETPRKLFKLNYTPDNLILASISKQDYFIVGRNDRIEVLNDKGGLVRRVPFSISSGKVIVLDKKVILFNGNRSLVVNNQFIPLKDDITNQLNNILDIYDAKLGNASNLLLVKENSVLLSSKEFQEKFVAKVTSQPTSIRTINGPNKGVMVVDSQNNLYFFDIHGELYKGYPHNLRKANGIITMDDGTVFAVTISDSTLESRQVVADVPAIL